MKNIMIIGSGLSALSAAYYAAKNDIKVEIYSKDLPERSQSIMAAGGMNCCGDVHGDTVDLHISDTLKSSAGVADKAMIEALCSDAPDILADLSDMGILFNREEDGSISRRAMGGQSIKRTVFAGSSTGKQIMTGLERSLRQYEKKGLVNFHFGVKFTEALIKDGKAYGCVFYNARTKKMEVAYADYLIFATGGMNGVYGNTTGSKQNDAYAVAKLFKQGVELSNLEFVQFHPTSIKTVNKNMLISESARGEGGRLFYVDENKNRVYLLEQKYGSKGNLVTRDIVSREMFNAPSQVYLDISFLDKKLIETKLGEIQSVCKDFIDLDVTKNPIPVEPVVHFFMGGIAVDNSHQTNIENLYAVGEAACAYHGANRLGGNSLLAAIHSARVAVSAICKENESKQSVSFDLNLEDIQKEYSADKTNYAGSKVELFDVMLSNVGIVRNKESLEYALSRIQSIQEQSPNPVLILAEAITKAALERAESRGSHYRTDYPETKQEFEYPSYAKYNGNVLIGAKR